MSKKTRGNAFHKGQTQRFFAILVASILSISCVVCAGCSTHDEESSQNDSAQSESVNNSGDKSSGGESTQDKNTSSSESASYNYISCDELKELMESGDMESDDAPVFIMDTRVFSAYGDLHIDHAVSLPASVIEVRIREIPTDKPVVVYAQNEERIDEVIKTLEDNGIDISQVKVLEGGLDAWAVEDYPMVVGEVPHC